MNKLLIRDHKKLFKQAMEVMDHQLFKIERVLPNEAVKKLQQVTIWLEYEERIILVPFTILVGSGWSIMV